ncbi:uncharacterized protein LOC133390345 isoform X2 [Rhineura floridana]|uniref:uncharacterized protein LOC133390345 isoform X2 n=1 Tax=Rhineura floridana TaxID=261503 RepID=UPI002AC8841F|nr:uncharacterized protein LOC133390345 isoform X2 [Rhineura floridana]
MSKMSHHCSGTLPLLDDIHEQNVVFVICALESKTSNLCILKELLIKTLFSLTNKPTDSMFSIVSCAASKMLKWQNNLVKCSLTNITEAAAWIRALQSSSGASALSAVAAALEDPTCQAVYLFTSGLPESVVEEICGYLKETEQERPVHIVHLVGSGEENKHTSQEILEKIALVSDGSFQAISSDRTSDEDNPGCNVGICNSNCISKQHCFPLLLGHHSTTQFPLDSLNPDSSKAFLRSSITDIIDWSPMIHSLQRGIQVLARRETDGYYYLGHIVQEVKGSRECVLIKFERSQQSRKGKTQCRMQETPLYDVIHYEDARWQPLAPGDAILAPWEKKGERYGPGIVLQVVETGSSHSAFKNSTVLVSFWNGQTKNVSADVAVRIPPPLSERIILELQMPLAARQMLVEQNPDYPYVVPPGYRASGPCWQNHLDEMHWQDTPVVHGVGASCSSTHHPLCHFRFPAWESFKSPVCTVQLDDALIPGTNLTKEELSRKIEEQLSKGRLPISESNEKEKEESKKPKEANNVTDLKSCEEMESKFTKPNKDHQRQRASEDPSKGPSTMVDVAANTDKCMTPLKQRDLFQIEALFQPNMKKSSAQPCQRSPSRKTDASQLQATFNWVDQSLKKDRSAIESVFHIRRSYSTPAIQRLVVKGATQDGPQETDVNTARTEFKRQKWEQRRLKEEQQQQEECLKRQLLLDNKRSCLLQMPANEITPANLARLSKAGEQWQLDCVAHEAAPGCKCREEETGIVLPGRPKEQREPKARVLEGTAQAEGKLADRT